MGGGGDVCHVSEVLCQLLCISYGRNQYAACDAFALGYGCGAYDGYSCGECFHYDQRLYFAA